MWKTLKLVYMKDKIVNLNLAGIWNALLKKACAILQKDIEAISGKKVKVYFDFYSEVSLEGKVTGFQSSMLVREEFGRMIIEAEDEENDQCVIVKIGQFNPSKIGIKIFKTGHTEKAAVFFQKTSMELVLVSRVIDQEAFWVNLEAFPSQEFCKHCVNWLFHDIHPVFKKEKKEDVTAK